MSYNPYRYGPMDCDCDDCRSPDGGRVLDVAMAQELAFAEDANREVERMLA